MGFGRACSTPFCPSLFLNLVIGLYRQNPDNVIKLWFSNGSEGYKNRIIWGVFRKSPSNDPQLPGLVDQCHDVSFLNFQLIPELSFLFLHLGQGPGQMIGNPGAWNTY